MHQDTFKIYVEQLRAGKEQDFDESFSPDFLEIENEEIEFNNPVAVKGKTYLAGDDLILNFDIETKVLIPCSICNKNVPVTIRLDNFYHAEPLTEIRSGVFDFRSVLREAILLETPMFSECNEGNCSKRKELQKYMKKDSSDEEVEGYQPFKDLEL